MVVIRSRSSSTGSAFMDYIACMAGICPNGRKGGKEAEGVGKGGDRLETPSGAPLQKTEELICDWETRFLFFWGGGDA